MHKIFQTEEAAAFGFVPSRSGTPLLIVWTGESAVEKFAVVYKLDYGEFLKAASWKEVYEYQDEDEEYRVHVYSTMPSAFFCPTAKLPSGSLLPRPSLDISSRRRYPPNS
jgi:hypothetical protein